MRRLNVGCGRDYRDGWVNVDVSKEVKADHFLDISRDRLPYPNGVFAEVFCSGVLEQIFSNEHLVAAMNEMHRLLQPAGVLTVVVPNARYAIAHRDPFDVRKFTTETFLYFLKGTKEYRLYGSVYGFAGWSRVLIEENARHILTVTMTK